MLWNHTYGQAGGLSGRPFMDGIKAASGMYRIAECEWRLA